MPCVFFGVIVWTTGSGDNMQEVASEMRVPTMMLAAGNDGDDVKVLGLLHTALRNSGVKESDLHFQEFADMKHGWVNRGDLTDPATAAGAEEAVTLVEGFFRRHLLQQPAHLLQPQVAAAAAAAAGGGSGCGGGGDDDDAE
jgi:hypothetical protein